MTTVDFDRIASPSGAAARPLVVDLDGTLVSTDLLLESASAYVTHHPLQALSMAGWLARGRTTLKHELASRNSFDAGALPYRDEVLEWLRDEHAAGRELVLASASDHRLVAGVADHLGIFSETLGTADGVNLKSAAKRDALVERFGERGFDYVGNHADDLPVWAAAATAHVVGDERLAARAARVTELGVSFAPARNTLASLLRAMRPTQWLKNTLVAVPLLTAQLVGDWGAVSRTLIAFAAFCLVASSVYVLNDLADVANDRRHPKKRLRPFASGALDLRTGWIAWPLLTVAGFAVGATLGSWQFTVVLAVYLVSTMLYTFWAKHRAIGDVVILGGLYTLRVVAGAVAIDVPLTLWLLSFSMLFFLSLALVKRVSELGRLRREGGNAEDRARGRGYWPSDLEVLSAYGVATSIGAVVVFCLYVDSVREQGAYSTPELLWISVPILLTWLMRVWLLAHRGQMDEDPIVFATKDWRSLLAFAGVAASFVAAWMLTL